MQITISIESSNDKQVAEAIVFLSQFTKAAAPARPGPVRAVAPATAEQPDAVAPGKAKGFVASQMAAYTKAKRGRPAKVKAPEQAAPEEPKAQPTPVDPEPAPVAAALTPGVHEAAPAKPGVFDDLKDDIPAEPVKPAPPLGAVQVAIEKLVGRKGLPFTRELLARYGVQRGRDLKEAQRSEFIQEASKLSQEPTR
jgi:hypothetical protein